MKKALSLLLVIALLASCLAGCGSKKEVEFGARVKKFIDEASTNAGAMHTLCYFESQCLLEDGIETGEMDEAYFNKCMDRYSKQLAEWLLDGDDVSDNYLSVMTTRTERIQEEYPNIMNMNVKAENGDELKEVVRRLYEAHQRLLILSTSIYGPAEKFYDDANSAFLDATDARQEGIDLLRPYYQKPGYAALIAQ